MTAETSKTAADEVIEISDSDDEAGVSVAGDRMSPIHSHLIFLISLIFIQTGDHQQLNPTTLRSQKMPDSYSEKQWDDKRVKERDYRSIQRLTSEYAFIGSLPMASADFSQSVQKFKWVSSCLLNCLVAGAYPKAAEQWQTDDLNQILNDGNTMYRQAMTRECEISFCL